jgi:hypothetical protein
VQPVGVFDFGSRLLDDGKLNVIKGLWQDREHYFDVRTRTSWKQSFYSRLRAFQLFVECAGIGQDGKRFVDLRDGKARICDVDLRRGSFWVDVQCQSILAVRFDFVDFKSFI